MIACKWDPISFYKQSQHDRKAKSLETKAGLNFYKKF